MLVALSGARGNPSNQVTPHDLPRSNRACVTSGFAPEAKGAVVTHRRNPLQSDGAMTGSAIDSGRSKRDFFQSSRQGRTVAGLCSVSEQFGHWSGRSCKARRTRLRGNDRFVVGARIFQYLVCQASRTSRAAKAANRAGNRIRSPASSRRRNPGRADSKAAKTTSRASRAVRTIPTSNPVVPKEERLRPTAGPFFCLKPTRRSCQFIGVFR